MLSPRNLCRAEKDGEFFGTRKQRPLSAVAHGERAEFSPDPYRMVPQVAAAAALKKKWIETIVRNRIYKQKKLEELYMKELRENKQLTMEEIGAVWEQVMNEINNIP